MKTQVFMSIIVCLCIVFLSTSAQGVVISLSTHSSEPSVPASLLDADVELSVADVGYWELSVKVTNLTPQSAGDPGFNMSELYFNTTASITNLTLDSVVNGNKDNWTLTLNMDSILVGGFGLFDIGLESTVPNGGRIGPGDTVTFKIMIAGTPPYLDTDFYDLSEWNETGKVYVFGAAKFFNDDMSAYGAYVPEPATIFLLGLGALALLRKRGT